MIKVEEDLQVPKLRLENLLSLNGKEKQVFTFLRSKLTSLLSTHVENLPFCNIFSFIKAPQTFFSSKLTMQTFNILWHHDLHFVLLLIVGKKFLRTSK